MTSVMPPDNPPYAEIVVDLDAIGGNVRRLRELVAPAGLIVVVKADGYGHGMLEVARAARGAGADQIAVATPAEAVALRDAGDEGPLLCWLATPGADYGPAIGRGVTVTAYDAAQLVAIAGGARSGRPVDVQLKVDTGLSRGGAQRDEWHHLFAVAADLARTGEIRVSGIWSHFACSDEPDHPANDTQQTAFRDAVALAAGAGLEPPVHLANSAAALLRPSARLDAVRVGLAAYGLDPAPGQPGTAAAGLRPAMTARTRLAMVKDIGPGDGVSYGHTFVAERAMTVGLVPVGYGDGVPRHASNTAEVLVGGRRCRVLGRICMDQFVVDVSGLDAEAGDEVLLFGPGDDGEPTAQDWAEACDTISYEIVTRIGGRFARRFEGRVPGGAAR